MVMWVGERPTYPLGWRYSRNADGCLVVHMPKRREFFVPKDEEEDFRAFLIAGLKELDHKP